MSSIFPIPPQGSRLLGRLSLACCLLFCQQSWGAGDGFSTASEANYKADLRKVGSLINAFVDQGGLYDSRAILAWAKKKSPSFDRYSEEQQDRLLQEAYSRRMRKIFLDNTFKERLGSVVGLFFLILFYTFFLFFAAVFGEQVGQGKAFDRIDVAFHMRTIYSGGRFSGRFLKALLGSMPLVLLSLYQAGPENPTALWIRWYFWPDQYLENSLEELERLYITRKDKLSPRLIAHIEGKFRHLYQNPTVEFTSGLRDEISTLIKLSQPPRYAQLSFDQELLNKELESYKPEIQKKIKTAIFTIKKISSSLSKGREVARIAFLFVGPPGTGKTRLANLIFRAAGLPPPMEINLEGDEQDIFGRPEKMGRITQARIARGYGVNANLAIIMNDADRALLVKDSAIYLHVLDATKNTYQDPFFTHVNLRCELPPITIMTVNERPQDKDAKLDRFAVIIDFEDPFTDEGFMRIGLAYLDKLVRDHREEGGPELSDFTLAEKEAIRATILQAKQEKKSIRQLENMLRDGFMQKWEAKEMG